MAEGCTPDQTVHHDRGSSKSSTPGTRNSHSPRAQRSPRGGDELNSLSEPRSPSKGRENFAVKNLSHADGPQTCVRSRNNRTSLVDREGRQEPLTRAARSTGNTRSEADRPPSRQEETIQLNRDEQRCLVLCDVAHSVWENMKDDVNLAWPTYQSVYERLNETPMRERHDFRSVQMCLLTTYAMKSPVLIADCDDGGSSSAVVLAAFSCFHHLALDDTTKIMDCLLRDLENRVKDGARLVICGEAHGASFAKRATLTLLTKLTSDTCTRPRVTCVVVGPLMTSAQDAAVDARWANHFAALTSSVYQCKHEDTSHSENMHMCVGRHLGVTLGTCCNLQLQNGGGYHHLFQPSSVLSADDKAFTSNLELYLAASPHTPPVRPAAYSCPAMPRQDKPCLLCKEKCSLFRISAASRQVEQAHVNVLKRAVEYISISVLQRSKEHSSAAYASTSPAKFLEDEHVFRCLKDLAHLATPEEEKSDWGKRLDQLLATSLFEDRGLAAAVQNDKICDLLDKVAKALTSALLLKADSASNVMRVVTFTYAAVRGIHATTAIASPLVYAGGVIAGYAAERCVARGIQIYCEKKEQEAEQKMTPKQRDRRYRDILMSLLSARSSEDIRWSHLSALQLESLLTNTAICPVFDEATDDSVKALIRKMSMAKFMFKLRLSLTQTCHITLVGPQNAGKSTFVKEVWREEAVPNIGKLTHTEEVGVYIITDRIKVLDFPGTTSKRKSIREEFSRLSAMAGIVIFLAKYDGSPNAHVEEEYRKVKEFAGNAPMLVCLTQVYRAWDDDDEEETVDIIRQKWASYLECSYDDVLLTELKDHSPEMQKAGVAGSDKIRNWLEKQLVRMEIYNKDDKELGLAVRRKPAQP